ncbi:hypothetical protein SAMN05421805_103529 [Saccharopolyspora antimicrobica]|uniref:Uncharacterized protein n=1 Tax=Saccharopolyspora antimicrobica TaxID=455193 RepID=A0A1I4XQA6_9PSEU|nr:hypothetical protein [Saccharopolyspora antimicrobica]RKT84590.1 hypothetical protein ATL45_2913 [Saccharopolyspora antimicrobica]SFN27613.1 hypothetical protein SAMN05421805_103529 [Saccharopolyspora antimicrobica]
MSDWEQFLDRVPWFGGTAVAGEAKPWTRGPVPGLPALSALLGSATVTPVSEDGEAYELLTWGPPEDRRGWLCHPPRQEGTEEFHPIHRAFLAVCGGITEWFGEPGSWWRNLDEVLTADIANMQLSEVLDAGLEVPVQADEYYVVAVEANGNLTLAHHRSGRLLLFAQDHAFTGATPLPDCPPLLTIDEIPDLATWIETCAPAHQP